MYFLSLKEFGVWICICLSDLPFYISFDSKMEFGFSLKFLCAFFQNLDKENGVKGFFEFVFGRRFLGLNFLNVLYDLVFDL